MRAFRVSSVHVVHLTAPEVLAQLDALAAVAEAAEAPRGVEALAGTDVRLALVHV